MGPAPMIRMVEMSVRLGINSHGQEFGHKKRARVPRVPCAGARDRPCARVSLDQISQPRKGFRAAINRQFRGMRAPPSLFELRRGSLRLQLARLAEAAERRRLEARPGFE